MGGTCLWCSEDGLGTAPPERHERTALDAAVGIVTRVDADFACDERARLLELEVEAVWRTATAARNELAEC